MVTILTILLPGISCVTGQLRKHHQTPTRIEESHHSAKLKFDFDSLNDDTDSEDMDTGETVDVPVHVVHDELGGSYSGGHGSGHKVKPRKPGPYGKPTPNFKCKKSSETLYVTKTEWTFDKKCFNVFKVKCTESYDEGKVRIIH